MQLDKNGSTRQIMVEIHIGYVGLVGLETSRVDIEPVI